MYIVADYASWSQMIELCTGLITFEEACKVVEERSIQCIVSYLSVAMLQQSDQVIKVLAEQVYQAARQKDGQFYDYDQGMLTGIQANFVFCKMFIFDGTHNYERTICACKIPEPVCEVI